MFDNFLGQIMLFAGTFAPKNWALCNGQLLSISTNQALFSILGTTYGGDGVTNFALPDLRGRVATHFGPNGDLPPIALGQMYGTETNTILSSQMPSHSHVVKGTPVFNLTVNGSDDEDLDTPVGTFLRKTPDTNTYASTPTSGGESGPTAFSIPSAPSGGSQPIKNIQPTLTMTYCIALAGVYPSRN